MIRKSYLLLTMLLVSSGWLLPTRCGAQQGYMVNLSPLDGVSITPENIFNYSIQASKDATVNIRGTIRYKNSNLYMAYTLVYPLQQGMNSIDGGTVNPTWEFSSSSLRSLFTTHHVLPEGTYEYCVSVTAQGTPAEHNLGAENECLYHREDGIFSINLVDPEDKAKLKVYDPVLSWVANYSFASELKYRLRVAEIKHNQNPVNAVMRNQPVFDERNLLQNSMVYPVYAKPLEKNKPYAWTVDAYYNEILLGGAETWQFIIVDDTALNTPPANRSYVDIKRENGKTQLVFAGSMKLKYTLEKKHKDILDLKLLNDKKEPVAIRPGQLQVIYGDNRYQIDLKDSCSLKHNKDYTLQINSGSGETYFLPFKYLNPDLLIK